MRAIAGEETLHHLLIFETKWTEKGEFMDSFKINYSRKLTQKFPLWHNGIGGMGAWRCRFNLQPHTEGYGSSVAAAAA